MSLWSGISCTLNWSNGYYQSDLYSIDVVLEKDLTIFVNLKDRTIISYHFTWGLQYGYNTGRKFIQIYSQICQNRRLNWESLSTKFTDKDNNYWHIWFGWFWKYGIEHTFFLTQRLSLNIARAEWGKK